MHKDGRKYLGQWKAGRKHGIGRQYFHHAQYLGYFSNGDISGKGIYWAIDGIKYEGEFRNNLFQGPGKLQQFNGEIFEGEFSRGR